MKRKTFLTLVACVASAVGAVAVAYPDALLASKGVVLAPAVRVWMREVGVLIVAFGLMAFAMRRHGDSPTMRVFLAGNAAVHLGLFPIELVAWSEGVIPRLAGIVPNSVLHVVLAVGFIKFARQVDTRVP